MNKRLAFLAIAAAAAFGPGMGSAQAAEVVVTASVTCAPTGPAVAGCVAAAVVVHEIVQLANGKDAFGPNGEGMKLLRGLGDLFGGGGGGGGKYQGGPVESIRTQRLRN